MNEWKSSAEKMIEESNWNGLYDLTRKLIKDEKYERIPRFLLFICCHFTTPPRMEGVIELEVEPEDRDAEEALDWLNTLPESKCRNLLHAAALSFSDVEGSLEELNGELEKNPSPDVYIMLAVSYAGSPEEKDYFDQAIKLDSNCAFALYKRSVIESKKGNYESAKDFLKRAIKACDDYAMVRYDLSSIYAKEGNEDLRREQLEKIIQIDSNSYFGKIAKDELEGKSLPVEPYSPQSEFFEKVSSVIQVGVSWGSIFVVIKVIYGFKHGLGAIESIFSEGGLIVFAIGFAAGTWHGVTMHFNV